MIRRTFLSLAVVAFALWAMPVLAEDPKPGTHEGKVVKVDGNKLTMTDKDGKNQHTHTVPATAKITLNGKEAKLGDLKEGTQLKVTVEKQERVVIGRDGDDAVAVLENRVRAGRQPNCARPLHEPDHRRPLAREDGFTEGAAD